MSDLPPHTLATHGVPTRHGFQAGSPVLVIQYIHSVQSSQQPLRLRADDIATNRRLLCPRLRTAGPRLPRQGQALSAPAPPGSLAHSVAQPRVAVRSRATAKGANAAALPLRNLACMRGKIGPRRNPDPP